MSLKGSRKKVRCPNRLGEWRQVCFDGRMRHTIPLVMAAVLLGCDDRAQVVSVPTKTKVSEAIEFADAALLPESVADDLAGLLESTGDSTTVSIPKGARYVIRIYRNGGSEEEELLSQKGRSESEDVEIGLYCLRDHRFEDDRVLIEELTEQVVLELPNAATSAQVPAWEYRPMIFHCRKGVIVSTEEQAVVVMYHPNQMAPETFEDAVKFARERKVESLVATIALSEEEQSQALAE